MDTLLCFTSPHLADSPNPPHPPQLALLASLPGADALRCHVLSVLSSACAVLGNRARDERRAPREREKRQGAALRTGCCARRTDAAARRPRPQGGA